MKKQLGQNFLRNKDISKKIIELSEFTSDLDIYEIGPGDGSLTDHLIHLQNKLTLIEYDSQLINPLKNRYKKENINIINTDARIYKLDDPKKCFVIGNLPYYASNRIIRNFMFQTSVKSMVFTVQKEVGEQIVANDGKKSYLSILIQSYCTVKKLLVIKNTEFYPIPKVDSMTVKITPKGNDLDSKYLEFVRKSFSNPRKKISNSISMGLKLEMDNTIDLLKNSNIDVSKRAQHLSLDDWRNLYNLYCKKYD